MRCKLLTSWMFFTILSALVGGASLAYFTSDVRNDKLAKFSLGTVGIEVAKGENISESYTEFVENRNLEWSIKNQSTGDIRLRVKILESGRDTDQDIDLTSASSQWEKKKDGYYYFENLVEQQEAVVFPLEVVFNTWDSIGDYGLTIGAEAIQASNNAINNLWLGNGDEQ